MLVQLMTNQYSYRNYQQQKNNQHTSFKSERGEKVLKEIVSSGASDSAGIGKVLQIMGIGFMGLVSLSTLRDVLGEVFKKKAEYEKSLDHRKQIVENEHKAKLAELDSQKQTFEEEKQAFEKERVAKLEELRIQEEDRKADEILLKTQRDAFEEMKKTQEEEWNQKREEIEQKENALKNVTQIMKQAETEKIISSVRALYGATDEKIKIYQSVGEQILMITDILNKNINKLEDVEPSAPQDIQKAMKDNDGFIESNMLEFLKRIIEMGGLCDIYDLQEAIRLVRDDTGRLDVEKSAHFISLLSFNNNSIRSVINVVSDFYDSKPVDNIIIQTDEFGEVSLSEGLCKRYMTLKDRLESLQKEYAETQNERDQRLGDLKKHHAYDFYTVDDFKEAQQYCDTENQKICSDYGQRLDFINNQIHRIKSKMTDILITAKGRSK